MELRRRYRYVYFRVRKGKPVADKAVTKIASPSPNHDARPPGGGIDMLIFHYTGMLDGAAALSRLCDPAAKVSAHYLVEEDGRVFALVDESRRAWHAGISRWGDRTDINGCSIGIELVNPGHEFGYRRFPEIQIATVIALAREILARHKIPGGCVLGHADVAPARKQDPGELFPWRRLAEAGIGLWPQDVEGDSIGFDDSAALSAVGYDVEGAGVGDCVRAFQRHWRQEAIDGVMDEECRARLADLLRQAGAP
jgi:N-acetylmuramoyl-L-alanine amidase